MKNWQPDIDLDRLLAALGEEIIDTSDEDIRTLCGQAGAPISGVARDMRARIAAVAEDLSEIDSALPCGDIALLRELCFRSN
jgi:hypothetical protein